MPCYHNPRAYSETVPCGREVARMDRRELTRRPSEVTCAGCLDSDEVREASDVQPLFLGYERAA